MATLTQSRKRVKPARFVRLALRPFGKNPGVVRLTVGKVSNDYLLEPLTSDFGTAYRLTKDDGGESYHVNLDGEKSSCECKGFLRWHRCKHVEGLRKLVEVGQLPARQSAPQKVA